MKTVIFPMLMEYYEERNLLHLNPHDTGGNADISTHHPQKFLQGKSNCQAGVSVSSYRQTYIISKPFVPFKLLRLIT
jgi:hypothetical protein